jgi:hypothetical protein
MSRVWGNNTGVSSFVGSLRPSVANQLRGPLLLRASEMVFTACWAKFRADRCLVTCSENTINSRREDYVVEGGKMEMTYSLVELRDDELARPIFVVT